MRGHLQHRGGDAWRIKVYLGRSLDGRRRHLERTVRGTRRDVRVIVTLEGPDADTSQRLRAAVDQHCPVLDLFCAGVPITTSLAD